MITLLDLPDHVLASILDNLNQKQKLALVSVNKEMYLIAITSLYRSIYVNFEKPLLIDTDFCTSFNCKYTIVNDENKFIRLLHVRKKLLRNIKLIMFSDYSINQYGRAFKQISPSIKLCLESALGFTQHQYVDIIDEFRFPTSLQAKENTVYKTTRLIFNLRNRNSSNELWRDMDQYFFDNLPFLKAVEIVNITRNALESFLSNLDYRFHVQELLLKTEIWELEDLFEQFNLNSITCFELRFLKIPIQLSKLSGFKALFDKLSNLKHLNITSESRVIDYILDLLKPNTLISLDIGPYKPSELSAIPRVISTQKNSIVNFSTGTKWAPSGILEEFERICIPDVDFPIPGSEDMVIKSLSHVITEYPRLSHIVCRSVWRGSSNFSTSTCCHFKVNRSGSAINIEPM